MPQYVSKLNSRPMRYAKQQSMHMENICTLYTLVLKQYAKNMSCGYEVSGMILLKAYLCTYSLQRGISLSSFHLAQ
jgi:hypothetical protein